MMRTTLPVIWTVQQDKVCIKPGGKCPAFFNAACDERFLLLVLSFTIM